MFGYSTSDMTKLTAAVSTIAELLSRVELILRRQESFAYLNKLLTSLEFTNELRCSYGHLTNNFHPLQQSESVSHKSTPVKTFTSECIYQNSTVRALL